MNLHTLKHLQKMVSAACKGVIVLVLFSLVHSGHAQSDSLKLLKKDSTVITVKYPSKDTLREVMNDPDYNYENDPQPPGNPFEKWIDWIMSKIRDFFRSKSYENFWQYVLMFCGLVLLLFFLYKAKVLNYIFPPKRDTAEIDYIVGQENIHEMNFEKSIDNAIRGGDYRLGIRLQYLRTLRTLSDKQMISWRPDRTNAAYAEELRSYPFQKDFSGITRHFEFAWYGDFPVDSAAYEEMKQLVDSFFTKLKQPAAYV